MKEIVKVLLQEGIDEETIHEVLDVIEEKYELGKGTLRAAKDKYKEAEKIWRENKISDEQLGEIIRKKREIEKKLNKSVDGMSKGEIERYNQSQDEIKRQEEPYGGKGQRVTPNKFIGWSHQVYKNPDYQHAKKIARKALKGHEQEGMDHYDLYKTGKHIIKHRKKLGEAIEEVLEALKDSIKAHKDTFNKLSDKVESRLPYAEYKSDISKGEDEEHGMPAYRKSSRNTGKRRDSYSGSGYYDADGNYTYDEHKGPGEYYWDKKIEGDGYTVKRRDDRVPKVK